MEVLIPYELDPVGGVLGSLFIYLVNALYTAVSLLSDPALYPSDHGLKLIDERKPTYDFIIVGASTAGCILANRLSAQCDFKVLLLEAGGVPHASTEVPQLHLTLASGIEDWQFIAEPEKRACGAYPGGRCIISKGKVLGGSSTIDNLHYVRGFDQDYGTWMSDIWSPDNFENVFRTLEKYAGRTNDHFQELGTRGDLPVRFFNETLKVRRFLKTVYAKVGYREIPRRKQLGFTNSLVYAKDGLRQNMAKTYLCPLKDRKNFFLGLHSIATEVAIASCCGVSDNRAAGVNVNIGGQNVFVAAKKEVILTAGAINNAKLLMTGGIGPKKHLQQIGIKTLVDLPVGKNLQFHYGVPIFVSIDRCCVCHQCVKPICTSGAFNVKKMYNSTYHFIFNHDGYYTHTGINDFVAYVNTAVRKMDYPTVAIYHYYFKKNDFFLPHFLNTRKFPEASIKSLLKINKEKILFLFVPTLVKPKSRGEITIACSGCSKNPKIKPNFFTDDDDRDFHTLLSGIEFVVNLTSLEFFGGKLVDFDIPNCRNHKYCTQPYLKCLITSLGSPNFDVAGTTKMGTECSMDSVVNEGLEVNGVRGLRVGDASVMPEITTGSTRASEAAIGEKLADLIKSKWIKDYVSPIDASIPLNVL